MQLSVRAKLTLLVASPLALIGIAMPVLTYVQHLELVDAADDQVQARDLIGQIFGMWDRIVVIVGGVLAIWGRIKATHRIG